MKKIIVSGGAGFIGKHLIKRLEQDGFKVINWDIVDGYDICDASLNATDVGAVFHLACPVNPANYKQVALNTVLASSQGTHNMLQLASRNQAKFLYVSSSEVYGEINKRSFAEDDLVLLNPRAERAFYDSSKLIGEVLTMIYHRYYGLDVRIIRPFNIYGPGMRSDDTRVIPSFMRKIQAKQPIVITGDGSAARTFCYIDDFIEGMMRAMFYPKTNGEVFNLGTTESVTIQLLAKRLIRALKRPVELQYGKARVGEQHKRRPKIKKAKELLGWQPIIKLKKGLELTWQSYL